MLNLEGIEEPQFSKRLARKNELAITFTNKVQAVEEETKKFRIYYNLFLHEVEKGQYDRNQKFQQENEYLLNLK